MTIWANEASHFWGRLNCEALFKVFDTSAHANDGVPDVSSDQVLAHVTECSACQDDDIRVSLLTDSTEQLEGGSVG